MPKLVVVGSLNMDLVVRTPHLPRPGETILGREFMTAPGGKGANQTVAAAKLGATVHMIGRVGGDDFGRALRDNLCAAGADDSYVFIEDTAASGIAIIEVDDSGQNTIVVAPGANAHVARADVDAARSIIAVSQAVIAQLEIPLDTVWYALETARAAQVLTILNPAPAQPLSTELLSLVDLLVPNESEAALLTGIEVKDEPSAEQAARPTTRAWRARRRHYVGCTRGAGVERAGRATRAAVSREGGRYHGGRGCVCRRAGDGLCGSSRSRRGFARSQRGRRAGGHQVRRAAVHAHARRT